MNRQLFVIAAVLTLLGFRASVMAQRVAITGVVHDESGAALPGVTITATRGDTTVTAVTAADGSFSVSVDAGSYDVVASLRDFVTARIRVTVQVGQAQSVDLRLARSISRAPALRRLPPPPPPPPPAPAPPTAAPPTARGRQPHRIPVPPLATVVRQRTRQSPFSLPRIATKEPRRRCRMGPIGRATALCISDRSTSMCRGSIVRAMSNGRCGGGCGARIPTRIS